MLSPAEYIELIQTTPSDVVEFIMNYMTLAFAFLTMAYLVGKRLSISQLVFVSGLYTLLAFYLLATVVVTYGVLYSLLREFMLQYPALASKHYPGRGAGREIVGPILMVVWLASIIFLVTVKRKPELGDT